MSHTIVYRKCFLRLDGDHTTDGKTRYLPLILCGDNNVYESATGKRCRDWGSLFPKLTIPATESELIDQVKAIPDDAECFVYNSKWLHGRDMKDFVSYGIRHAKTIEELKLSSQGVSLLLYYIEKSDNGYGAHTCDMLYAKTSEDIVTWIENHRNKPIRMHFSPKEFKLRTKPTDEPVVLKGTNNRYVYDFGRNNEGHICRVAFGPLKDVKVFYSYDEAKEIADTFRDLRIVQYKNVTKNKPWRVLAGNDLYVKKLSSRHLWFTTETDEARKFANQKEAETYINEKLAPRFDRNFKAINTQRMTAEV